LNGKGNGVNRKGRRERKESPAFLLLLIETRAILKGAR
jgi:hypothetical protein